MRPTTPGDTSAPRPTTLSAALAAAADAGDHRGFRFLDRREQVTELPYDQLYDRALAVATGLAERGLRPGERVGIVLPTSPGFMSAFFGCHLAGAVPCPVYPPFRLGRHDEYVERTAAILAKADAVALVTDARVSRLLGEVAQQLQPRLGVLRIDHLETTRHDGHAVSRVADDDLGLVQFSSGTTRLPAAVGLTHAQLLANVDAMLDALPDSATSRGGVCWLPLYHDMGLVGCVLSSVRAAAPLTLIDPADFLLRPALWLRAMSRYEAAGSPAPDFAYARCVDKITDDELDGVDLGGWVFALDGAEPIAPRTLRRFESRFARCGLSDHALTPVYGLAEAALAVSFSSMNAPWSSTHFERAALSDGEAIPTGDGLGLELVSVGRPLPGFDVRIVDDRRDDVDARRVGHVLARGPSVTSGYLGPDRAPIDESGWLDTGDLGFLHDGQLYICGRVRDIIVMHGRNHSPHDIERAVDPLPDVRTGCTVAVADIDESGERLVVFVERARDSTADDEEVAAQCRREIRTATMLDASEVVVVAPGTLPRTSSGKLRRRETLVRWQRGELAAPDAVTKTFLARKLARSALGHLRARHRARKQRKASGDSR